MIRDNATTPSLSNTGLWAMTVATGLVVANIYYNQPLLADISKELNISSAQAGLIAMCTQAGYACGMLFMVPLGDMLRRKRLIMFQFLFSICALLATAWAPNLQILLAASFLTGAFSIIPQLIVPMAAHLSSPDKRGRTIGIVMSGLLVGILLSRTVSGYVGAHYGWRSMFLIAAFTMIALWITLYFLLPEVYPTYKGTYGALMHSLLSLIREEPRLRVAAIRGALCFATFAGFWTTLAFLLREPPFNAGSDVAGAFGLVGAFGALAASQMGRLSDRGSNYRLTTYSILMVIVSYLLFGLFGQSFAGLIAGVILMDMGVQATHISNQSVIFNLRPEARNRLNTVYMVTYFSGGVLGTFLAGQAWQFFKWTGVVCMGTGLSLAALLVHLSLRSSARK